ncbi:MAG TPA: hypothetical protein VEG84_10535, partial [Thermoanaerobaculia bacterium]|nr:hypothetical protein [Thermoanaerobaculia bacterium]
ASPIEQRAATSGELARWANRMVAEHPNASEAKQIRFEMPALFKGETLAALDQKRPRLAALFYRAYLSLDFAPADAELARRMSSEVFHRTPTPRS